MMSLVAAVPSTGKFNKQGEVLTEHEDVVQKLRRKMKKKKHILYLNLIR